MQYSELELAVGETIHIGNQTLTLLDTEGELALFHLDADDEYRPVSSDELYEILAGSYEVATLPR